MADAELEAIREARLQQLKQNQGGGDEKEGAADEGKRMDLARILSPEARERLSRIALVKPEHADRVQDMLLKMAKSGQIRSQVTEQQLVGLLDQVSTVVSGASTTKVTVSVLVILFYPLTIDSLIESRITTQTMTLICSLLF